MGRRDGRRDRRSLARPGAALRCRCSTGWKGGRRRRPGDAAGLPAADAGAPVARTTSWTRSILPTSRRSGSGTASACSWRARIAGAAGVVFSRSGDDVTGAFPEIAEAMRFSAVLDGELLVVRDGVVAPFGDLQQRLGRKTPSQSMRVRFPAHVRLYDILFEPARTFGRCRSPSDGPGWRHGIAHAPERMDLSPLVAVRIVAELAALRGGCARRRHRRADAEAQGQRPMCRTTEGAMVQVEARPAHDRLRADVRPARPRQALVLLFRLHLRLLAAGRRWPPPSWCRSARPISALPMRS